MATGHNVHQAGKHVAPQAKTSQSAAVPSPANNVDAAWSSPYQHLQGGIVTAMDVWRNAQHGNWLPEATPSRADSTLLLPRVTKRQAFPKDHEGKRPKLCPSISPGTPSDLPRLPLSKVQQLQDGQPVSGETLLGLLSTLLPPQIVRCDRVNPREQRTQFATVIAQQKQWALVYFSYAHNAALMITPIPVTDPSFESLHVDARQWAAQFPIAANHEKRETEFHIFKDLPIQGNECDDGIIALVFLLHVAVSDMDVSSTLQMPSIDAKVWQYLLHRLLKRDESDSSPPNDPSLEKLLHNTQHAEDLATKLVAAARRYHQEIISFKSQALEFESVCGAAKAADLSGPLLGTTQGLMHQAEEYREKQLRNGRPRADKFLNIVLHLQEAVDQLKKSINAQLLHSEVS